VLAFSAFEVRYMRPRNLRTAVSLSATAASAEELVKNLMYNRRISEQGLATVDELIASAPAMPAEEWWLGRYILCSSYLLAEALRDAGKWRMLDGAPVFVTLAGSGGQPHVEVETDLLVLSCDTGLRVSGFAELCGDEQAGTTLRLVLDRTEFFEPSDEFGITKALDKCEAELRPLMPSEAATITTTLQPLFVDERLLILRESSEEREPKTLILSRLPAEEA